MLSKAKAILKGWRNYATRDEVPDQLAAKRASICASCPHAVKGLLIQMIEDELKEIKGYKCDLCGCPLSAKIRQRIEPCDLNKW